MPSSLPLRASAVVASLCRGFKKPLEVAGRLVGNEESHFAETHLSRRSLEPIGLPPSRRAGCQPVEIICLHATEVPAFPFPFFTF